MTEFGPGATLGILGAGQLGRMLAMAAARLGIKTVSLSPETDPPASDVGAHIAAAYDDTRALEELASRCDVVTYEFENIDLAAPRLIEERVPVRPGSEALRVAQDRRIEKTTLSEHGIPTAPFEFVDDAKVVETAVERWGKCVLKTCRFGYDGKGQVVLDSAGEAASAWREIGEVPAIVEAWIEFACEASVIIARDQRGQTACFDVTRNHHEANILRRSTVPSGLSAEVEERAKDVASQIAAALDYVGVLGVEFFVGADGELRVNEIAPRVHNSGHWTLDACRVSQFEQHVRAVMGWPLGQPVRHSDAVMENLIGDEVLAWREWAARADSSLHLYRKDAVKPGRKMGHVTHTTPIVL